MGYRQRFIAEKIPDGPISIDTLQKHFKKEWKTGKRHPIQLTQEQILYKKAISGKSSRRSEAARIKWLQLIGEWKTK